MTLHKRLPLIFFGSLLMLIVIAISMQQFDFPLAIWIADNLYSKTLNVKSLNVPDFLIVAATILTILSWSVYLWLVRQHAHDKYLSLCRVTGTVLPIAVATKSFLKWVFGRVETRAWLSDPSLQGFHWFAGADTFQGFPSGHMLVLTPLFLVMWNYFPRYRLFYGTAWICLGIALIVTEYHFLSDVLAGGYVGAIVYVCVQSWIRSSELKRKLKCVQCSPINRGSN